jgi:hypothetical protein
MSFIRIKEIGKRGGKKYRYAYLVSNKWKKSISGGKRGSRQKVSKYLGRVVCFEKQKDIGFFEYILKNEKDISRYLEKTKKDIVEDLVKYELFLRGFVVGVDSITKEGVCFEMQNHKFICESGCEDKAAIEMNEGFLCNHTLTELINFRACDDDEHVVGIKLAKCFLEAGLNVPKEVFIAYFNKC